MMDKDSQLKKVSDSEELKQIIENLNFLLECQRSTQKSLAHVQRDVYGVLDLLNGIRVVTNNWSWKTRQEKK